MTADDWSFAPPAFDTIAVDGVSRAFGRLHALYRCSFRLDAGEVVAVVGPNGAGKTTLLQLLATLDRPTEGTITFGGRHDSVKSRHGIRPHIGFVAHDSLLYAELSGLENLRFTARLYGLDPTLAETWIDRVGLRDAADRAVAGYSRGMRQRLSIARALLPEPTLVLFDEPLTGLDSAARAFLYETIGRLQRARRAVLVVTHHLDWPAETLHRALVLEDGRLRHDGPVGASLAALYAQEVRR